MLNVNYILQLVSHYVRNKQLTYDDFELTFPFLTQMEKYKVVEVLEQNEIELVDEYTGVGTLDEQTFFIGDDEIDSFDDDSFVRDEDCNESGVQEATIVRTSVNVNIILYKKWKIILYNFSSFQAGFLGMHAYPSACMTALLWKLRMSDEVVCRGSH